MAKKIHVSEYIHQSNLIEGYDDPAFDAQGMIAWDYLCKQKRLTHAVVQKVQKILTLKQTDLQPDWRGYYRKIDVWVGGHKGMDPDKILKAMTQWVYYQSNRTPKESHIEFERIHPFVDGNGRTGRMLMWWQEVQNGDKPTIIWNDEKQAYYWWFK